MVWFKTKMSGWRKSPLLLRRAFDNNLTSDKMWNETVTEVKIQSVFCGIPGRWETVIVGGRAREVCLKADTNFYRNINGACLPKQVGPNKNRTGSLSVGIILMEKQQESSIVPVIEETPPKSPPDSNSTTSISPHFVILHTISGKTYT